MNPFIYSKLRAFLCLIFLFPLLLISEESLNITISYEELRKGIQEGIDRVHEFKELKKEAKKLGIRVWLFGGTAASFVEYVKSDLQRLKGDKRYQEERFTYDYTDIYRSTQDMDIVIEGKAEQALALERLLAQKFPYFMGNKSVWEVRLLRESLSDKEALLDNSDFRKQHTDSHSVGMIELGEKESQIKDLRHWHADTPPFLKAILKGEISYYYSKNHKETTRYKEGKNPEIFSVIRYLTKVFQYDLKVKDEDLKNIKKIINDFSINDLTTAYAEYWIENNGKKLIFHSMNVEKSWNLLGDLGLREKLISLGDTQKVDSLAWWLNREPLREKELGQGEGRTAKELGLEIVAHETSDFKAYEIITRSYKGEPNVLISRQGHIGEAAVIGDGFYTMIGKEGGAGTGFTIRFEVEPRAKENRDFIIDGDMVLILNKKAIRVIPEGFNLEIRELFDILLTGENDWDKERGLLEKLIRKIDHQIINGVFKREDVEYVVKKMETLINKETIFRSEALKLWFKLEVSAKYPELVEKLIKKGDTLSLILIAEYVLSQPHWAHHSEWVERVIDKGDRDVLKAIAKFILSQVHWGNHSELVEKLIKKGDSLVVLLHIAEFVLSQAHWKNNPELVEKLIDKGDSPVLNHIAEFVLSQAHWAHHPELVEKLMNTGEGFILAYIAEHVLSKAHWKNHPELVEKFINTGNTLKDIAKFVLSKTYWKDPPKWVEWVGKRININRGNSYILQLTAEYILSQPHWKGYPELVEKLINKADGDSYVLRKIAEYVLSKAHWKDHPEWVEKLINKADGDSYVLMKIAEYVLSKAHWKDYPHLVEKLINSTEDSYVLRYIDRYVLSKAHWRNNPTLRELSGDNNPTVSRLIKAIKDKKQATKKDKCVDLFSR